MRLAPKLSLAPFIDVNTMSKQPCAVISKDFKQVSANKTSSLHNNLERLIIKAEKGDPAAQNNLGYNIQYGTPGLAADEEKAVYWYRRAAEQKYPTAMYSLAVCLEYGYGLKPNPKKAFAGYMKAAEENDSDAQFSVAIAYQCGKGVDKIDSKAAVAWYNTAALSGHPGALNNLGLLYRQGGESVPKNYNIAFSLIYAAAERHYPIAQFNLGDMYRDGRGTKPDPGLAAAWYMKAAHNGDADAMFNVGVCYQHGFGLPKNVDEAVKWYHKAAKHKHDKACQILANI